MYFKNRYFYKHSFIFKSRHIDHIMSFNNGNKKYRNINFHYMSYFKDDFENKSDYYSHTFKNVSERKENNRAFEYCNIFKNALGKSKTNTFFNIST